MFTSNVRFGLFLLLLAACKPQLKDDQIKALQTEVERLKAPQGTPSIQSEEFGTFLKLGRRMVGAIETGITFEDLHARLPDLKVSAKEVIRRLPESQTRTQIAAFTDALIDAHSLWRYKISEQKLIVALDKTSSGYEPRNSGLGNHWDNKFNELNHTYNFTGIGTFDNPEARALLDYGSNPELRIDNALKKILKGTSINPQLLASGIAYR